MFHFTVTKGTEIEGWSSRRIDKEMLSEHLSPPSKDSYLITCGPPGMMDEVTKILSQLQDKENLKNKEWKNTNLYHMGGKNNPTQMVVKENAIGKIYKWNPYVV